MYNFIFRIDASRDNGYARFFNDDHKSPNMRLKIVKINNVSYPVFFARKIIEPDTELCYDYGGNHDNYWWRKNKSKVQKSNNTSEDIHCKSKTELPSEEMSVHSLKDTSVSATSADSCRKTVIDETIDTFECNGGEDVPNSNLIPNNELQAITLTERENIVISNEEEVDLIGVKPITIIIKSTNDQETKPSQQIVTSFSMIVDLNDPEPFPEATVNNYPLTTENAITYTEAVHETPITRQNEFEKIDNIRTLQNLDVPIPSDRRECDNLISEIDTTENNTKNFQELNTIDPISVTAHYDSIPLEIHNYHGTSAITKSGKKKYPNSRPLRLCKFCGAYLTRLLRHVRTVHKDEEEVKEMFKKSPNKRRDEMGVIRRKGILQHNLCVMNGNGEGNLQMEKKCTSAKLNVTMCSNCNAFLSRRTSSKHKCNKRSAVKVSCISATALRIIKEDEDFARKIVNKIHDDEIGTICKEDSTILMLGIHMHQSLEGNCKEIESRKRTMKYMRQIASLADAFKDAADQHEKKLETLDMFHSRYFEYVKLAIKKLTETKTIVTHSMKLAYGYALRTAGKAVKGYYLLSGNDKEKAENAGLFLDALSHEWGIMFKASECHGKKRRQEALRRPARLPSDEHRQLIRTHILNELNNFEHENENIDKHGYITLRRLTVTRIIFFNGRRVNEPGRMKIKHMKEAFSSEWISQTSLNKLPEDGQSEAMKDFYITFIEGKNTGTLVDVIIPKSLGKYLEILMSPKARVNAGIHPDNDYVFPQTGNSQDHCSGWHDVSFVVQSCKNMPSLNATDIRHFLSTAFAGVNNTDKVRKLFYKHLGHSEEVNKEVQ